MKEDTKSRKANWTIEIFTNYLDEDDFDFEVNINGEKMFTIDCNDAEDTTEVMGMIGEYINSVGWPMTCVYNLKK